MFQLSIQSVLTACLCLFWVVSAQAKVVTDLAGREVTLPAKVERIILGEGRYIPALAILEQEQVINRVVGMMGDFKLTDPDTYNVYRKQFPAIDKIPLIGKASAGSFSLEQALALKADLAIFGLEGHGPSARHAETISTLENAGVTIVFIDFRQNPMLNTTRSIDLLGQVLGLEQRAQAFIADYTLELQRVESILAQQSLPAPHVFLHSRVGLSELCCETMVRGMQAEFLERVNANNIARELVPGSAGVIDLEYLLENQPDVYIATAVGSSKTAQEWPQFIVLGTGVSKQTAKSSLKLATQQKGINQLNAVKNEQAFAIWHHFYNNPFNVVAVQVFAKWLYPEQFAELNPEHTLERLFKSYQPVPLKGTYWTGL